MPPPEGARKPVPLSGRLKRSFRQNQFVTLANAASCKRATRAEKKSRCEMNRNGFRRNWFYLRVGYRRYFTTPTKIARVIFKELVHLGTRNTNSMVIVWVVTNLALVVPRRNGGSWRWCWCCLRAGPRTVFGMVPQVLLQRVAIDSYFVRICFSGVADSTRLVSLSRGGGGRRRGGRCPESKAEPKSEDREKRISR